MPFWSKYADLLVGIVCITSVFCFLGSRDIADVRERRIAGTAADVADNGYWLLPHLEGKPRILKPPFADWIAVGSMRLLGRNEFGFRLPFALAGWIELPMSARRSIVSFAQGINRVVPGNEPIYFTHSKEALPFYARREFRRLDLDPQPQAIVSALASKKQGYFLVSQDNHEMLMNLGKDQLMFEVILRHESSEKNNAIPLLLVHFVTRK